MRLLLVGAHSDYAIERPYLNYLSAINGIEHVELFKAQNRFLDYYDKSLFNKVFYRAGFSTILYDINQSLKSKIEEINPHAVFVFKGMEIFPATLKWIKNNNIKLINYNPDNPFIFSGKGSGNKNITNSIGLYDFHFTYDAEIKRRIELEYKLPVEILPFGFDIPPDVYETISLQTEINSVCFLGSPDWQRAEFLNSLANQNIEIDVFGNNWKNFLINDKINAHDAVYDDRFFKILNVYRIQLNLMRVHNPTSHNMRTFEVPAIGGILLAPNTTDHAYFFKPEKEIFLYNNIEDCVAQIKKIQNLPLSAIKLIRQSARERSLTSGYSYRDRAMQVFKIIEKLIAR